VPGTDPVVSIDPVEPVEPVELEPVEPEAVELVEPELELELAAVTTGVGEDSAGALSPLALLAVSSTMTVLPTSPAVSV